MHQALFSYCKEMPLGVGAFALKSMAYKRPAREGTSLIKWRVSSEIITLSTWLLISLPKGSLKPFFDGKLPEGREAFGTSGTGLLQRNDFFSSKEWLLPQLQLVTLQCFFDAKTIGVDLSNQTWGGPAVFLTLSVVKPCLLGCGHSCFSQEITVFVTGLLVKKIIPSCMMIAFYYQWW